MKYILTDIDGVLTDGRVTLDINGNETKNVCYRDLDAIGIGHKNGYVFFFVTGENTPMVDVIAKRFGVENVFKGAKDKLAVLQNISAEKNIPLSEMIYIGDSHRDAPALSAVGIGIAPKDAAFSAKKAAKYITDSNGGYGVLLEVTDKILLGEWG
jgi:YrbI family 3-deoxy-D-manno-octulosonate 8-phosphate phosphatase